MNNLEKTLNGMIDHHAAPIRKGQRESHSVESLSARTLVPADAVPELIARGVIQPLNPVARGRENGPMVFDSDHLNEIRRMCCAEIVANTIAQSDGDDDAIQLACGHALHTHAAQFNAKPKTKHLHRLIGSAAVMFRSYDDEQPSTLARLGKTAAVIGGAAAVGAGAAYARGRYGAGTGAPNVGVAETIKGGLGLLKRDAQNAITGAVAGVRQGAGALGGNPILNAAKEAARGLRDANKASYLRKVRALAGMK